MTSVWYFPDEEPENDSLNYEDEEWLMQAIDDNNEPDWDDY